MGNAERTASRIVAESEGARREREIHELERDFAGAPADRPYSGRSGEETDPADSAQGRFDEAMGVVSTLLNDGPPALGKVLHRADDGGGGADDIREIATFCRAVAGEMAGGEMAEYFVQLGRAMEELAEAWESNPS